MTRMLPRASLGAALSIALALVSPAPVGADGVPVFHDRVAKRDPAGDVKGDRTRPVDIRRVVYDHYRTGEGPNDRMVLKVRFADLISDDVTLRWEISTSRDDHVSVRWAVGGKLKVKRGGDRVSNRGTRRSVDGRVATLTLPWSKLGSPRKVTQIGLLATYGVDGSDTVTIRRVLH